MAIAARDLVAIYVDCTQRGAEAALQQRFSVTGYPTVLFLDRTGTKVGELGDRTPAAVRAQIEAVVRDHGTRRPPPRTPRAPAEPATPPPSDGSAPSERVRVADATLEEGLELARTERKLLAVVFCDPDEQRREAHTELVIEALRGRGLDQLPERFVWIRRPLCDDIGMNTPEADGYLLRRSPTVLLFDPWTERPKGSETRPFPAVLTLEELDLKSVRAALERATLEAARAGHPPAPPRPR